MKSPRMDCGLFVVAIFTISTAIAQEDIIPGRYEPDHLVPIVPKPGDSHARYMDALLPHLKLNATFFARMVLLPSFEGESCLRLHGHDGDVDISKSGKFSLTCYQADKSIWYSMPENSRDRKQGEVVVSVSSVPVSEAFAKRLRAIWDQMLSRTKPLEKANTGLDGATFQFATPEYSGKAWSPMKPGSPRLFVQLGESLVRYCKAVPDKRARLMLRLSVEEHATNLENHLKEHPGK